MFQKGDRVQVVGFRGRSAILRVWEDKGRGLLLCSEATFRRAEQGGELVAVGFPMCDIKGLADEDEPVAPGE
jgi:hypothetical protein